MAFKKSLILLQSFIVVSGAATANRQLE